MRVGISFKFAHLSLELEPILNCIDFIEYTPEHFVKLNKEEMSFMKKMTKDMPVFWHCIMGDVAGLYPINESFFTQTRKVMSQFNFLGFSDHMAYYRDGRGNYYYELLPSFCTKESKNNIVSRTYEISKLLFDQKYIIQLENPAFIHKENYVGEQLELYEHVISKIDHGHLDLENLWLNAMNFKYSLEETEKWILDRAKQFSYVHLARGKQSSWNILKDIEYIDSHSGIPTLKYWQVDVLKKLIALNNDLNICLEIDTVYDVKEAETFLINLRKELDNVIHQTKAT